MGQILFVTGTDTGVGKTLVTALLLKHLRRQGVDVLATKPFCSGGRRDLAILSRSQAPGIPQPWLCPFYFGEPTAPLVAARKSGCLVPLASVLNHVRGLAGKCELLLVEGVGGLFVPLGEGYMVSDVIGALSCPVLLVARNKLGVVNHVLLSLSALRSLSVPAVTIVLSDMQRVTPASQTNCPLLRELCRPAAVFQLPYLGRSPTSTAALKRAEKKLQKTRAAIVRTAILSPAFRKAQARLRKA